MELLERTALELRDSIARGEVSAREAAEAVFAAIEARDGQIRAYLSTDRERALAQAEDVDRRIAAGERVGSLAGVPVAIKDNMCTTWGTTTCASRILESFRAPYNADVVERLLGADAVIVGKCNLDEFAMGSSTENSAFGATRNPWDPGTVPGGSSGGSAAAVAAEMAFAALGSDTGGSIRQPASLCGVVGLKPTYGRVSRYGLVAFASSLDQIGPVTKDIRDAALLMKVIAGHDARDSTSVDLPCPDYLAEIDRPIEGLRVGMVKEFMGQGADGEVAAAIEAALKVYQRLGASLVEVSLPHSRIDVDERGNLSSYAVATYYIVATAEASSNLARYDGVHYGYRTERCEDMIDMYAASRAQGFGEEVKRRIMLGTYALSSGYYDAYYLKALKVRTLIKRDFEAAFEKADVLACPTSPTAAFRLGERTADPLTMYLSDIFTISVNLAGIAGISIPCGLTSSGLPIGLQLISGAFTEDRLLRAARMFECAVGGTEQHQRRPALGAV